MRIRRYEPDDLSQITALFYDTVHAVNAGRLFPGAAGRLGRWRAGPGPLEPVPAGGTIRWWRWRTEGLIVGFGDIDGTGYLDRLYVHRDRQGQGIAHGAAGPAGAGGGRARDHHPSLHHSPAFF